jgi:hypothetical protein
VPQRTRPPFRTPSSIRALQLSSPSPLNSPRRQLSSASQEHERNSSGQRVGVKRVGGQQQQQRKWSAMAVKGGAGVGMRFGGHRGAHVADDDDDDDGDELDEVDELSSAMAEEKAMLRRIVEARRQEDLERLMGNSSRMSDRTAGTSGPQLMPLVLLHVSILPCTMPAYSRQSLDTLAPKWVVDNYHLLREKLGDAVLARGVLIPHPGEEFDVLEERLLETLELCTPRLLGCGHFYAGSDTEDEEEPQRSKEDQEGLRAICDFAHNDRKADSEDNEAEEVCETCSHHMRLPNKGAGRGSRRWDVKFFAANGLMREGAWSAAWREMERVDVEITPWMPQDVKRALDQALDDEHKAAVNDHRERELQFEMMKLEAIAAQQRAQQLEDRLRAELSEKVLKTTTIKEKPQVEVKSKPRISEVAPALDEVHVVGNDIPLRHLLRNYIYVMAEDKRNIAVAVLSVLVLLLGIFLGTRGSATVSPIPTAISMSCTPSIRTPEFATIASAVNQNIDSSSMHLSETLVSAPALLFLTESADHVITNSADDATGLGNTASATHGTQYQSVVSPEVPSL